MNGLFYRALISGLLITTMSFPVCAREYKGNGSAAIPAVVNAGNVVRASYEVSLDPLLELKWDRMDQYIGKYSVGVKGKVSGKSVISVEPDDDFILKCNGRTERGIVKQEKRSWGNVSVHGGNVLPIREDRYTYTEGCAYATVKGEGYFKGGLGFTFRVLKDA